MHLVLHHRSPVILSQPNIADTSIHFQFPRATTSDLYTSACIKTRPRNPTSHLRPHATNITFDSSHSFFTSHRTHPIRIPRIHSRPPTTVVRYARIYALAASLSPLLLSRARTGEESPGGAINVSRAHGWRTAAMQIRRGGRLWAQQWPRDMDLRCASAVFRFLGTTREKVRADGFWVLIYEGLWETWFSGRAENFSMGCRRELVWIIRGERFRQYVQTDE